MSKRSFKPVHSKPNTKDFLNQFDRIFEPEARTIPYCAVCGERLEGRYVTASVKLFDREECCDFHPRCWEEYHRA